MTPKDLLRLIRDACQELLKTADKNRRINIEGILDNVTRIENREGIVRER